MQMSVASKSLHCFDSTTNSTAKSSNNMQLFFRSCVIKGSYNHSKRFSAVTMASNVELKVVSPALGHINFDIIIKDEKDKVIPIQQLKADGRFNPFHKYDNNVLSIQLRDKNKCKHIKSKHVEVHMRFMHTFVTGFYWQWEFLAHISCTEPVFYAYILEKESEGYYLVFKEFSTDIVLEASWINSMPPRHMQNKCLSQGTYLTQGDMITYNCNRNMVIVQVLPDSSYVTSWNSVLELCASVGAQLPVLRNIFYLEEFLAVLRHFTKRQLHAIFIGLYKDPLKHVSKISSFVRIELSFC